MTAAGKHFDLLQVFRDPRGGVTQTHFDTYDTLAEAKKAAKQFRPGSRWVIVENKIVARSDD